MPSNRGARDSYLCPYFSPRGNCPCLEILIVHHLANTGLRRSSLSLFLTVRLFKLRPLCLRIFALGVCFPALCGFLSASASHRGQGFPLAAGGFTWCVRAAVGLALGLGDIPAHAPCHGLAVAHGWHLVVAACPAVGICDVVAVLVSIDDRCVCQALSCRRKR